MPLKAGTCLGSYEILSLLGAGGMGEVYKARDPKLNRCVAIKVLPASLAENQEFLARFEREAKAVAALSHPNVLGIFEFGSDQGIHFAVMELLEGESLREKLRCGPMPVKRAIELAIELANGLGAAHAQGIVHRDVKPENLFLTREGRLKVLDFGLAKQVPAKGSLADGETEAIDLAQGTQAGMVLGTVGYMSPEQVLGEAVDPRSDIFAFGVVLHEMVSGARPFHGETPMHTLTAILDADPPELTSSRGPLPPGLERLVAHCLEKRPEARFQSMRDLAYSLQNLSGVVSSAPGAVRPPRPRRPAYLFNAAGAVGVLLLGALLWACHLPPFASHDQPSFTRLSHLPGTVEAAFFGPDGRTVYFSERIQGGLPELFVLNPGSPEPRPLGVKNALLLGVSATGNLALLRNPERYYGSTLRGTLAQTDSAGGSLKEIRESVVEATWDGSGFAAVVDSQRLKETLEFGGKTVLEGTASTIGMKCPRLSPDGASLALLFSDGISKSSVLTLDRNGRRKVLFTKAGDADANTLTGLAWSAGGDLWFSEILGDQTAVWSLSARGSRRLLWRGQGTQSLMDVSADGRMLLADQQIRRGVLVQKAGEAQGRDISIASGTQALGFSADGRTLLLLESPVMDGNTADDRTYLWNQETGGTSLVGRGTPCSLSPDGRWIHLQLPGLELKDLDPAIAGALRSAGLEPAAALDPSGKAPFLLFMPAGAGLPLALRLPREIGHTWMAQLLPDGKHCLFLSEDQQLWYVLDRQTGSLRALNQPKYGIAFAGLMPLSPDASRLILGGDGIFAIQSLAGGGPEPIRGMHLDERPIAWAQDQRAIYLRNLTLPTQITRLELADGSRRPVFTFQPSDASGLVMVRSVDATPDARSFAISYVRKLSNLYLAEGIR